MPHFLTKICHHTKSFLSKVPGIRRFVAPQEGQAGLDQGPLGTGGPLRGTRYQLQSNDRNFQSTVGDFQKWMAELERVLTIHLFHNATSKPNIAFIKVETQEFNGVAYTSDYNGGKRIVVSSSYLRKIPANRRWQETSGVVIHELTHALQYNGGGRMPGHLIEAIADYIRMRAGLPSPNWQKDFNNINAAYGGGALFLDFIDRRYPGFVKSLNERARSSYSDALYQQITGKTKEQLFADYKRAHGR